MGLEIIMVPFGEAKVAWSKNPFIVFARYDGYVQLQDRKYTVQWNIGGQAADGNAFTLGGALGPGSIFVSDIPGNLEIMSYAASGASSISEWLVSHVLPVFNTHPQTSSKWVWTSGLNRLRATAKLSSSLSAISITSGFAPLTVAVNSTVAGQVGTVYKDRKLCMQVCCSLSHDQGNYNESSELIYDYQLSDDGLWGEVKVDLSEVVDSMLSEWDSVEIIESNAENAYRLRVMPRNVYVKVYTKNEIGAANQRLLTPTGTVLKGGIRINDMGNDMNLYTGTDSRPPELYITNQPSEVWTSKSAKLFLNWFNKWSSDEPTVIRAEVFYASNTSISQELSTIDNVNKPKRNVYSIVAGFDQLQLESFSPGSAVVKYKIFVEHDGSEIEKTFYLLPDTDLGCTLVYRNALGVPEGIWCEGERTTGLNHSKSFMDIGRGLAPDGLTIREKSYSRTVKPTITLNTQPMLLSEWQASLDMLLSDEIRIHFPEKDTWVVGQIEQGSIEESTVNWMGNNMVTIRVQVRLNEEVGWSTNRLN